MESEKVKEIKKALVQNVKTCLLYDFKKNTDCKVFQCKYILDYINELEECSEKWQKLCADEVALNTPLKERIKELETLCNKTYEDLTKEIDRLEEINKKLKQSNKNILFVNEQVIKRNEELEEYIKGNAGFGRSL